jgi:hypothetical protein
MKRLLGVGLALVLLVGCGAAQINATAVPGGMDNAKRDKLWQVAVNECLSQGFTIQMQDKDSGNLVCQKERKDNQLATGVIWTMRVQFDKEGWKVSIKSDDPLMDATMGASYPAAKKMNLKLQEAAGI